MQTFSLTCEEGSRLSLWKS